jgi:hypothetical protein
MQSFYGDKIDFSDDRFQYFIGVIGDPKPIESLNELGNKKLSPDVESTFRGKVIEFLKEKVYPDNMETIKPTHYYLYIEPVRSDRLYYEWKKNNLKINLALTINYSMIHLKPHEFIPQTGMTKKELAQLLFDTMNYNYKTVDELASAFDLLDNSNCKEGFIFTNAPPKPDASNKHPIYRLRDIIPNSERGWDKATWKTDTLGFISKTGICLFLDTSMSISSWALGDDDDAQKYNLPHTARTTWLMTKIYESDGKTLVLPSGVKELPKRWKWLLDEQKEIAKRKKEEHERKYRQWHGRDGRVLFRAQYITLKPKKEITILEHENGKFIEHKKHEFSKNDWNYIIQKFRENPEELSVHDGVIYRVIQGGIR